MSEPKSPASTPSPTLPKSPGGIGVGEVPLPGDAEVGERAPGPDPTRYGDWEKNGRCIDF